jgi:hypothetical protein
MTFETSILSLFNNVYKLIRTQPLVLGGYAGSGGGQGGPPGGYFGYLPQTRVAYDTDELATLATPSGATLLDNLNHIRARLNTVELSGVIGMTIEEDNVVVADDVTIVSFNDFFEVTKINDNEVDVSLLTAGVKSDTWYSGVFGENLTPQITGAEDHFTIAGTLDDASLRVYLNGVRQSQSVYTVDPAKTGFTTTFTPIAGDTLLVDYETAVDGFLHTHSQYALASGVLNIEQVQLLLANKADLAHTHTESDITDLGTINQQIVFTIASSGVVISGVRPLRIYAHDVNTEATISEILVAFNTPPVGEVRMNVLKNGATIFSPPAYVAVSPGAYTGYRTTNFLDDNFVKDDYFQIAVVQGDNTASDMTLHIRFSYNI